MRFSGARFFSIFFSFQEGVCCLHGRQIWDVGHIVIVTVSLLRYSGDG